MVIPIIAMLAVTMMIAGYRDEGEEQVDIEVDEGYDEISLEYLPENSSPISYPSDAAIANTSVNNDSYMDLHVIPRFIGSSSFRQMIRLVIIVEGMIDEELEPEYILLENEVSDSSTDFMLTETSINNESISEYHPQTDSIRRVGSYIHTNEFTFETLLQWDIYPENWGEPLTLELKATLRGLSEEVPATVNVHLEGGYEG
ncbi:MAG: hypothetical protein R6W73_00980 [Candidatus Saliniplasma sp.]